MLSFRLWGRGLAVVLILFSLRVEAADKVLVLTALQPTYSIARALAKDTAIEVRQAFPPDTGMDQQAAYLARRRRDDFIAAAKQADAVITISRVWQADPLFPAVRGWNIRVVEIDASTPFAPELAGVALLQWTKDGMPGSAEHPGALSPYIWLDPTNIVRMTDIVAADLRRLSEADAQTIDRNQQAFRGSILALKVAFESKLAELDDPSVILLSSDLAYLTNGTGVHVAALFPKSDFDWTDADVKALADKMTATGIRTVIAAGKPKDSVAAAIAAASSRLAVLDLMDPGIAGADGQLDPAGLVTALRGNLDQLLTALKP
jgi:ABC-type Zn uptake system ZnuABC Zn-binding protein ZnuA